MSKILPPGLSEPIALGPYAAAAHVMFESDELSQLLVVSVKIGDKLILGGGTPAANLPEGILVPAQKRLTLQLENTGSHDVQLKLAARVEGSESSDRHN